MGSGSQAAAIGREPAADRRDRADRGRPRSGAAGAAAAGGGHRRRACGSPRARSGLRSRSSRRARARRGRACRRGRSSAGGGRGIRWSARVSGPRPVRAPRGGELSCKGWPQEAALRMLMNNLDPEVAEAPDELVVYGGTGRAARNWEAFDALVRCLRELGNDESLLVQSGKPVGKFKTHDEAPRVLIANSNLVGQWSNYSEFNRLERLGLTMYGQMTAGSWIYIGSQGIVQGTFETFAEAGRQHFSGSLEGKFVVSGGGGGMGGGEAPSGKKKGGG